MGIILSWDNEEHTVLRCEFVGHWDRNDFKRSLVEAIELTKDRDKPVNAIMDFTKAGPLPPNAVLHAKTVLDYLPDNIVKIVLVTESPFVGNILSEFTKRYPKPGQEYYTVQSWDEARAIVAGGDDKSSTHNVHV